MTDMTDPAIRGCALLATVARNERIVTFDNGASVIEHLVNNIPDLLELKHMANFEDITGWREERRAYGETLPPPVMVDMHERHRNPLKKMPVAWLLVLVQVVKRHEETRVAFTTLGTWLLENHYDAEGKQVGADEEQMASFPYEAEDTARWFVDWFVSFGKQYTQPLEDNYALAHVVSEIVVRSDADITMKSLLSILKETDFERHFDLSGHEAGHE